MASSTVGLALPLLMRLKRLLLTIPWRQSTDCLTNFSVSLTGAEALDFLVLAALDCAVSDAVLASVSTLELWAAVVGVGVASAVTVAVPLADAEAAI